MRERTADAVARLQALLSVPLAIWLLVHLWQQWSVLDGREAWVDRVRHSAWSGPARSAFALALVLHIALGVLRGVAGPHPADADHGGGFRWVQRALGVVVLGFLAVHLPLVRFEPGPHTTVRDVYARLWEYLGEPGALAAHVIGAGAICAHLGLGLTRAVRTFGGALDRTTRLLGYWVAAVIAGLVFACFVQVLACFATGAPLFG